MYKKAYVEISNFCNLSCSFCHQPTREKLFMSPTDFFKIASEVKQFTDYIYLHVFGEPLLHPDFKEILKICNNLGLKVNITTNGSLISLQADAIISAKVRKISFSLHSFEGNQSNIDNNFSGQMLQNYKRQKFINYFGGIADFCDRANAENIIIELRLWNGGGKNSMNDEIAEFLAFRLGISASLFNNSNIKLKDNIYLGYSNVFNWASDNLKSGKQDYRKNFCLGLRDQFAILSDGTVVPCCIDSEGECALGNVNNKPLAEILSGDLANKIRDNFVVGKSYSPLCVACDFRKQ